MNPLRLRAENVRTFETLSLDLPEGCAAIVGEITDAPEGTSSNGAGKSTLAMLPALALFGRTAGRPLARHVTRGGDATEATVEMTFEHAGELYKVRRGYSLRGKGKPTLDLEHWDANAETWQPLTLQTVRDTQALIERTVGLTETTFRCSGYLAQKDGGALTLADPADRMAALTSALFGADPVWPRLLRLAQRDRRAAEAAVARLDASLDHADGELAALPDARAAYERATREADDAARLLAAAEKELEAQQAAWQQAQERSTERRAAEAELAAAHGALGQLDERRQAAESAAQSLAAADLELASLATPDDVAAAEERYAEARAECDAQTRERETLNARRVEAEQQWRNLTQEQQHGALRLAEIEKRLLALEDAPADQTVCALCQRPHTDESRHREIEALWSDRSAIDVRQVEIAEALNAAEARVAELRNELDALGPLDAPSDAEVRRAREQATERARLEERVHAWQAVVAETDGEAFLRRLADAKGAVDVAARALAELPPVDQAEIDRIKAAGLVARTEVNAQRARLDEARADTARLEAVLDRLRTLETQAAHERKERDRVRSELDALAVLERAYGRDGIPALIVENVAIPLIEQETNRVLAELGTLFRVELRTQRLKKDGDLKGTLDIVVVDEAGCEDDYEAFSGGEATRVDIALRVGLAVYMKTRGDGSGILIVDEPEGLDEAGMAALVRVMRRLESVFPRLLLVSHVPMLRDAFDNVITVVRDGAVSRVEAAAPLEAVAA